MLNKNIKSIQEWLPFEEVLERGIIKIKQQEYIKIIKVIPINFNLKSNLEKQTILNSYKNFLTTCNFSLQILIQSKKEDLNPIISNIQKEKENQTMHIQNIAQDYIQFIQRKNQENNSASKNFYIVIKEKLQSNLNYTQQNIIQELNENFLKVQETLSKCGNTVIEIIKKEETIQILQSFIQKNNNKEGEINSI